MKLITWTDDTGYAHRSLIRDCDYAADAPKIGIPNDPPDLDLLDWAAIVLPDDLDPDEFKRNLHNRLVKFGLITWTDVQRSQNGVTSAIMAVGRDRNILRAVKRPLIMLYKMEV